MTSILFSLRQCIPFLIWRRMIRSQRVVSCTVKWRQGSETFLVISLEIVVQTEVCNVLPHLIQTSV